MAVSAALVKELRERTGAGMMDCKKALEATNGDMALAADELRKSGRAKADKKANRIAAEGMVVIQATQDGKKVLMLEVNSETDFVARDTNFVEFTQQVARQALNHSEQEAVRILALPYAESSQTVDEARSNLVAKVGENVNIRRAALLDVPHAVGTYLHNQRIGVIVSLDQDNAELAKDIAMHIAASKPLVINPAEVPADVVAKEKEIFSAQAASSGKPPEIIDKMVSGRIKKFVDEVSLLGQPFVKDPNITVDNLLAKHRAKVQAFVRFEVGEGIEKEKEDFVEAVMSQVQGS